MNKAIITIGGKGVRMQCLSPLRKHLLHYIDMPIINHIINQVDEYIIIGEKSTNSRYETLLEAKGMKDCWIIDSDVIPVGIRNYKPERDTVFCFKSKINNKYGSVVSSSGKLSECSESVSLSDIKLSGAYYVTSVDDLLWKMDRQENKDSIGSSMIGADIIMENSFIRLGDPEDYYKAIGL